MQTYCCHHLKFTNAVRHRKCGFHLPVSYTNCLAARKYVSESVWRHCGKLDKFPVRPAPAFKQRPFEELLPRIWTEENHFVSNSAGEICANRHKPAFHLISLPQAIVQFSSVLPSRFRSQIFYIDITSLQIKSARVGTSPAILNSHKCWYRTFSSHGVSGLS